MDLFMTPDSYTMLYPTTWESAGFDYKIFFAALFVGGKITRETYELMLTMVGISPEATPTVPEGIVTVLGPYPASPTEEGGWLDDIAKASFAVLQSFWHWLKTQLGDLFTALWDYLQPRFEQLWETVKASFHAVAQGFISTVSKFLDAGGILTPEKALGFAMQLYAFALGAGITAHSTSVGLELFHPLKNLGAGQVAAAISDYAGFGRIAGATIGTMESKILGSAMTYALQFKYRPKIHAEGRLEELAVKGDIDLTKFRRLMGYQGYADEYIDDVIRTMYREPNYRELSLLAEDESATEFWLTDKLHRAGYDDGDAHLMTKALYKRSMMTQRTSYYSQCFYMFREGYIDREKFVSLISRLELRPEAIALGVAAAQQAYIYDTTKDMVTYYTNSYLKDLISKDELLVSLVSLGIVPQRATLLVRLAAVKRTPAPTKKVTATVDAATKQLQTKYVALYQNQYRKGFITEDQLLADLLAVGLTQDLAEVTTMLEVTRSASA